MPLWAWAFVTLVTFWCVFISMYNYSFQRGIPFREWKNPFNVLLGFPERVYHRAYDEVWDKDGNVLGELIEDELLIDIGANDEDEYMVYMTLYVWELYRRTPRVNWAPGWFWRRLKTGHAVRWHCKDGIPVQNVLSQTLGNIYSGEIDVEDDVYWRLEADKKLVKHIKEIRDEASYKAPIAKITKLTLDEEGLHGEGQLLAPADQLPEWLSLGWGIKHDGSLSISSEQATEAREWLEENLGPQRPPTVMPDDGMIVSPIDQIPDPEIDRNEYSFRQEVLPKSTHDSETGEPVPSDAPEIPTDFQSLVEMLDAEREERED